MKSHHALAAILSAAVLAVQAMPGMPTASQGATLNGEVLEVQRASSYTYLRLKTADGEVWAAVSSAGVEKGQRVTLDDAMTMENFESRALKRKFDRIVFGTLRAGKAPQGPPPGHGAATAAKAAPPLAKVAKATTADARTVAEVVKGKAALKDRNVTIRAQVVKVSTGVLGKNWLHLQDGTGTAADGTNDIVVTTKDAPAVGDIVHASGKVRADVDIGSGYRYAVLLEDANIRK